MYILLQLLLLFNVLFSLFLKVQKSLRSGKHFIPPLRSPHHHQKLYHIPPELTHDTIGQSHGAVAAFPVRTNGIVPPQNTL